MNTMSLADFSQFVEGLKPGIKRQYDRNINRDLSQQNWQGLFKRNIAMVLQQTYDESCSQLQKLLTEGRETGDHALAGQVLSTFDGFADEIIQYALQKHRTSCALSNFPDEHTPDQEYITSVLEEAEQDWQAFIQRINKILGNE